MKVQFIDLLPELHDYISSYCVVGDLINIACCNKDYHNAMKRILFRHLKIQWISLRAWPLFADKLDRFQYTHAINFYEVCLGAKPKWERISANYIEVLKHCYNLKKLHLSSTNSESVETTLQVVNYLVHLKLSYCYGLQSPCFQFLKNTSLERLALFSCNISDNVIEKIVNNCQLVEFEVDHCIGLSEYSLTCISEMKTLTKLTFSNNGNTTGFSCLSKLDNIRAFNFASVTIKSKEVNHICMTPIKLKSLVIPSCSNINDNAFISLSKQTSLTRLDLSFNDITDVTLHHVGKLKVLKELVLFGCKRITDEGIMKLDSLKTLCVLSLDHCVSLTDTSLSYINMLPLKTLRLNGCYHLTGRGMSHLTQMLLLEKLEVANCVNVSYEGLENFSQMKLKHLKITVTPFCPGAIKTFCDTSFMKPDENCCERAVHWILVNDFR